MWLIIILNNYKGYSVIINCFLPMTLCYLKGLDFTLEVLGSGETFLEERCMLFNNDSSRSIEDDLRIVNLKARTQLD